MWDLMKNIPIWLEAKVDIYLLGRFNTLNCIEKGEEVLLTNVFVDVMGSEALYDINFLAKRVKDTDREFFNQDYKVMMARQEVMIEGSFYVESREEFDYYFKVIK